MALVRSTTSLTITDPLLYDGVHNRPSDGHRWPGTFGRNISRDAIEVWDGGDWVSYLLPIFGAVRGTYIPTGGVDQQVGQTRIGHWAIHPGGLVDAYGAILDDGTGATSSGTGEFGLPFPAALDGLDTDAEWYPIGTAIDLTTTPTHAVCVADGDVGSETFVLYAGSSTLVSTASYIRFWIRYRAILTSPNDSQTTAFPGD